MPLVLEDDIRIVNGFDPASATTLYWKDVPVLVRQHDREDQTEQLTFRILSGVTKQNHSLRVSVMVQIVYPSSVVADRMGLTVAIYCCTAGAQDTCF